VSPPPWSGCACHVVGADAQRQQLIVQHANRGWRRRDFRSRHVAQNRNQPLRPKVSNQGLRPRDELGVEAPAQNRRVDVDAESFLVSILDFGSSVRLTFAMSRGATHVSAAPSAPSRG
jgi:hypothetical protein